MYNRTTIIWIGVLIIGLVLIGYSFINKNELALFSPAPEPSLSVQPSPAETPRPMPKKTSDMIPAGNLMLGNLPPAECSLGGEIVFHSANSYENIDNFLQYKNVDHSGRLIKWQISPQEDFRVGPSLFSGLKIPDGEELVSATMAVDVPRYKEYILTASITYGKWIKGVLEIFEASCRGSTLIKINY